MMMNYRIEFKPRALKDLQSLPLRERKRIFARIEKLQHNLAGDVKKLANFSPDYRLRVGEYRALFAIEAETVIIYRVMHRKEAYR